MTTPYVGEIMLFAGSFPPVGWARCNGALLSIADQSTLYALIGTTYGGDGVTTFAVPDLQGRVAVGQGQGPGLTNRVMGEKAGTETVTLTSGQMPIHTHNFITNNIDGNVDKPANTVVPARPKQVVGGTSATLYTDPTKPIVAGDIKPMQANTVGSTGGNQPHENIMPILAITYCIALEGIFPSQN
jgi:microcystin-dependent protein